MRARIQPQVQQLAIQQRQPSLRSQLARHLGVPRRLGVAVPFRVHLDRRSIHRVQPHRDLRIAGLHLDRPKAGHQRVFDHRFYQRPKAVRPIRQSQRGRQTRRPLPSFSALVRTRPRPCLDPPFHARDPVLDAVDRPPRRRCLRQPPQVRRRRLRQHRRYPRRPKRHQHVPRFQQRGRRTRLAFAPAPRSGRIHPGQLFPQAPHRRTQTHPSPPFATWRRAPKQKGRNRIGHAHASNSIQTYYLLPIHSLTPNS